MTANRIAAMEPRPMFQGMPIAEKLDLLAAERIPLYRQLAKFSLDAALPPREIAAGIKRLIKAPRSANRPIPAKAIAGLPENGNINSMYDDELVKFARDGALPLPASQESGWVAQAGARIWYATFGAGPAVILLHGGLGNAGNWGYQVPALVTAGYRAILIDSRGHGRSSRDTRPYSYEILASDVLAVLDRLELADAWLAGWSDGACTALVLAARAPQRVRGVFYFACNMDPSGVRTDIEYGSRIQNCLARHKLDYANLSATPAAFPDFFEAVGLMQRTQPNFSAADLGAIRVPVTIAQSQQDEFIKLEHAQYLAESIPGAHFVLLPGVSHFAPLQRPEVFNQSLLAFLAGYP